jgi:hypothetical protein
MKRALFVVFILGCPLIGGRLGGSPIQPPIHGEPVAAGQPPGITAMAHSEVASQEPGDPGDPGPRR